MQPYGYALGNPLRRADPTGLFSEEGPVSSPPSFRLPFRPGGPVVAQPKPVNKPGNVPPAPAVGFQEGPGRLGDVLIAGAAIGVLTPLPGDEIVLGGLAVIVGGITIGQLLDQILSRPGILQQGGEKGGEVEPRTTREGKPGVRITRPDGSVIDITPDRVKEFEPEPRAKKGLRQRKFPNPIPGSKGKKRLPTTEELDLLESLTGRR